MIGAVGAWGLGVDMIVVVAVESYIVDINFWIFEVYC